MTKSKVKIKENDKKTIRNLIVKLYIVSYGLNNFCKKFLMAYPIFMTNIKTA